MNICLHIWVTVTSEPILSTAKPNAEPTIDSTVDATVNPSEELWLPPTPASILSLEVNIKKQKWLLNIYLPIWVTVTSEPILPNATPNAEPSANPTIDPTINTTVEPTVNLSAEQWPTPTRTGILLLKL